MFVGGDSSRHHGDTWPLILGAGCQPAVMAGGDGCWQQLICPKLAWLPAGTWLATISGPASQPLRRKEEEGQSRLEGTNHKRKKHSNVITQKEIIFTKNVSNRLDKYHCYLVVLTSNLSNDGVLHMMRFQKTKQKMSVVLDYLSQN